MAIRRSINDIRVELTDRLIKAGEYWIDRQAADMGNYSGVVLVPNTQNMVYVRLTNGQVIQVFNNVAPNIYNFKVYIGRDKSQPGLLKVLEVRWIYSLANTVAYILFHHKQHEYPAPDTVWIRRDQFMPLLVLPGTGMTVQVYGDMIYNSSMVRPIKIDNQVVTLSSYITLPTSGAQYFLMEITPAGTFNFVAGATADTIATLKLTSPYPTPTAGSFPVCILALYAGQTSLRRDDTERDIIDLRMFTSEATGSVGTQVVVATEAYLTSLNDYIGFTTSAGTLKKISVKNFFKPVYKYINQIYAILKNTTVATGSAAGGDLSGTYPNPTVAKIGGVAETIDTDGTLVANSDSKLATQKAVKTYVDTHTGNSGVRLVMVPGISSPPVPVENVDGTDWVYTPV